MLLFGQCGVDPVLVTIPEQLTNTWGGTISVFKLKINRNEILISTIKSEMGVRELCKQTTKVKNVCSDEAPWFL